MKRLIITFVLAFAALLVISVYPVFGANSAGVSVTVTAKNIAISVDKGSYNYGALGVGATTETTSTFTIYNDGNVDEVFLIEGTSTADWTLNATAGDHLYGHQWSENGDPFTAMTANAQLMNGGTPVASGGSLSSVKFKILMPTVDSHFTQQSTSVKFTATE